MPRVPVYQPRVQARPLPDQKLGPAPGPEVFGAQQAEALTRLGGAVESFGGAALRPLLDIQQQQREQVDRTVVLKSDSDLFDVTTGLERAAKTVEGPDALDWRKTVQPEFDKAADKIAAGLTNPRQKLAFEARRQQRWQELTNTLEAYGGAEHKRWTDQEYTRGLQNRVSQGISSAEVEPELLRQDAEGRKIIEDKYGPRDSEQKTQALEAFQTALWGGAIDKLLTKSNPDVAGAQKYYDYATQKEEPRADGTKKGEGFFGPLVRPDGKVSTEISIGVEIDGKEVEIPTLVPTLTKAEVQQLLAVDIEHGEKIPDAIEEKAVAYAKERMAAGKSPFAGAGEQAPTYPDLARTVKPPTINGEVAARLNTRLQTASVEEDGLATSEDLWAKHDGDIAKIEAEARDIYKKDTPRLNATIKYAREKRTGIILAKADLDSKASGALWTAVVQELPFEDIARMRTFQEASGEVQNQIKNAAEAHQQSKIDRAYIDKQRARGEIDYEYTQAVRREAERERTGWGEYWRLTADPKAFAAMSRDSIITRAGDLGIDHVNRLLKLHDDLTDPNKVREAAIDADQFNGIAESHNLHPYDPKKTEQERATLGQLKAAVEAQIAKEQTGGKVLTRARKGEIAEEIIGQKVLLDWTLYPDPERFAVVVKPEDREQAYVPLDQIPTNGAATVSWMINYLRSTVPQLRGATDVQITKQYQRAIERAYAAKIMRLSDAEVVRRLTGGKPGAAAAPPVTVPAAAPPPPAPPPAPTPAHGEPPAPQPAHGKRQPLSPAAAAAPPPTSTDRFATIRADLEAASVTAARAATRPAASHTPTPPLPTRERLRQLRGDVGASEGAVAKPYSVKASDGSIHRFATLKEEEAFRASEKAAGRPVKE